MALVRFFAVLRARKWVALMVLTLTLGTTIALSLLLPKQYTATASLVVDLRPDPVTPMALTGAALPAYIATQVDVMYSDRVVGRVVRTLKLAESPTLREEWLNETKGEGLIDSWIGEAVKKKMLVEPARESNLIYVSYTAEDGHFAAEAANAIVQAYLDTSTELRVDPAKQYSAFFDSRAKVLRADVERAQAKLSAYQREKGIIVTEERMDFETQQLNQLASQLAMVQAMSAESSSRQAQAQGGSSDRLQEVVNNPMLAALRADLTRAEARLQELTSRLGDNHPQVIEARANIASVRGRLEIETRRVTGSVGVANNINRARENEVRAALEAQRTKVLRMKAVRDEGANLYRDVENTQRAYDAVLTRLNQASLESQVMQGNVYPLTRAIAPTKPSFPSLRLNATLALVLGAALAMAAALALEALDRRIRTLDEVPELLNVPAIGLLPKAGAPASIVGQGTAPLPGRPLAASLPPPAREA